MRSQSSRRRTRSVRSLFVVDLLEDRFVPATAPLLESAIIADSLAAPSVRNVSVDFRVTSDWGSGFVAEMTLTNHEGVAVTDWTMRFDFPHAITNIWGGTIASKQGNQYTIAPEDWTRTIGAGESIVVGFQGEPGGPAAPSNVQVTSGSTTNPPTDPPTDPPSTLPSISIADASVIEGYNAHFLQFTLRLSQPHTTEVVAKLRTLDGTAIAGEDYRATTATVRFAPGQTEITRSVAILGDRRPEPDETFFVEVHSPTNATIGRGMATATIVNDDGPVDEPLTVSIVDVSQPEGNKINDLYFTVQLSRPATQNVAVKFTTADGTALEWSDYRPLVATVSFAPGESTKSVRVFVVGDTKNEPDEYFYGVLHTPIGVTINRGTVVATLLNDDGPTTPVLPSLSVNDVTVTEPVSTSTAGFFHTQGNQIVDQNGNAVRIAGVNWFGMETPTFAPHGLWARNWQSMMDQMKSLGYNTIRLPYSNQLFDAGSVPNGINFSLNPDLQGLTGLQILDKIVDYAGDIGLRILLDHHRSDAGSGPNGNGLWYTSAYSEQRWINDWVMLATRYAGNPTVIGADLHNEPHGQATWGSGNLATDWRLAAQRAGNAILAVNSDWLIVVEGIQNFEGSTYWWGGNLQGARNFPVQLNVANRLVYSPHAYPASVYHQTWFNDPNYPNNLPAVWDAHWGYLYREGIAPVLLGEFGSNLENPLDAPWVDKMIDYISGDLDGNGTHDLDPGELGISWTWWSWNPNSGDTGGILKDDWTTIHQNKQDKLTPVQFDLGGGGGGPATATATFEVRLSAASTQTVTVAYTTAAGTATAGADFVPTSGTLTFAPGQTAKTVNVTILGDTIAEVDETFSLVLSAAVNATIGDGTGTGTIIDTSLGATASDEQRVVAYYTEWSTYDRDYQVADIPAEDLTHVIYAFANISPAGQVILFDPYAAVEKVFPGDSAGQSLKGNFNQLAKLKQQHPHLKTLIAIGGWTLSGEFSQVAATAASRQAFADSAVQFMRQYGFDGIDLDWEFPVSGGPAGGSPADKQNFTLLLQTLRSRLDQQSAIDQKEYLLTIATSAGYHNMQNLELDKIHQHVDWINVMTYDYHGAWESTTNHQAPLYRAAGDPADSRFNIDWTIQAYLAAGTPSDKLLMGLPLYARAWSGVGSTNNGLYRPASSATSGTWEAGVFDYSDMLARVKSQPSVYQRFWDSGAQVPYVYAAGIEGGLFSTFEDAQSVQRKIDYVLEHQLGGVFFWDLSGDVRDPNSPDALVPLAANLLIHP